MNDEQLLEFLTKAVDSRNGVIAALKEEIMEKDAIISVQEARIVALEQLLIKEGFPLPSQG